MFGAIGRFRTYKGITMYEPRHQPSLRRGGRSANSAHDRSSIIYATRVKVNNYSCHLIGFNMNSFFNLQHVMIVFHPGSAGNWLADLLHQIITGNLQEVKISDVGSSHNLDVIPELSFGTHKYMEAQFNSPGECFQHYYNFIDNYNIYERTIIVTHDFTNIPLYRQYYPNSKTIVISIDSPEEKLISTFFQIEKTILDPNFRPIFPRDIWKKITSNWLKKLKDIFVQEFNNIELAEFILNNRFQKQHKNIMTYLAIKDMIYRYNLGPLLEGANDKDTLNYISTYRYLTEHKINVIIETGDHCSTFVDSDCIMLPFKDLISNNSNSLIHVAEKSVQRELSYVEKEFIQDNLARFVINQSLDIMNDPFGFYNKVKDLALEDLKEFSI